MAAGRPCGGAHRGSVILAGILLKMGTYGFLRFSLPIFPDATVAAMGWIGWLAVIGIIYGALVAMVQPDIKKLVAYSSVSHLGFVMLGIFALNVQAIEGGILQMINHGISTGALFLAVGVLYERRHTRLITEYGGITKRMPIFAAIFMIVTLSSIGLPGLNGFVGEFLILLGAWQTNKLLTILATSGVIFAAVYMLWMFQRVMFGEITNPENEKLKDVNLREIAYFAPLIFFIFLLGVYPTPFIKKMEPTVEHLVQQVEVAKTRKSPESQYAQKMIIDTQIKHEGQGVKMTTIPMPDIKLSALARSWCCDHCDGGADHGSIRGEEGEGPPGLSLLAWRACRVGIDHEVAGRRVDHLFRYVCWSITSACSSS